MNETAVFRIGELIQQGRHAGRLVARGRQLAL